MIADDLTGACDAAAAFAQVGFPASVVLDEAGLAGCSADLLAYSTETRNAEEAEAACKTGLACDRLSETGRLILFKKIDSVLRGSPMKEVEAVRKRLGGIAVLLTPALPSQGRLVVNGSLSVIDPSTGRALQPACKITAEGNVRVADADCFEDLRRVAAEALNELDAPLFAGSAGLAEAVAVELARRLMPGGNRRAIERCSRPALILIGTEHPVTAVQVAALRDSGTAVEMPVSASAREPTGASTVVRLSWNSPPDLALLAARLARGDFGSLVLSGGDTARYVFDAFGAKEILLGGELEPGTPWGHVRGGPADGLTVVTKSGGFGREDLLIRIVEAVAPAKGG